MYFATLSFAEGFATEKSIKVIRGCLLITETTITGLARKGAQSQAHLNTLLKCCYLKITTTHLVSWPINFK